ncbi:MULTISPECIES: M28 family peptidase [unclassified Imperialibacter]|uniref:M28 family peptidase n=1 Tax=unclassified Imperialibacter TaxID=2629706 RepID=UPI0012539F1B|nr:MULTISPECIES: M28 family peptidase [unclassified Imperialibacter]CAD5291340.1 Aminopeptidase [Imperialibacter sp. 89]CAD5291563.1 Aminopeptidase [Imperialibacter sp. 75]VVT34368.1 Aminopeptidase [Imperialibacter sp. EC-SDR9]
MKRHLSILFAVALVAFGCEQKPPVNMLEEINKETLTNSKVYSTLADCMVKVGHRLTGSENGAKAEEYTYNLFKSYGIDVAYDPFEVESWSRGEVKTQFSSGSDWEEVSSVSLAHSPVSVDLEGEIIDMGNGIEEDYEANPGAVEGKIVFVYISILPETVDPSKNLHRSEKTKLAIDNGAAGIIFFNQVEGGVLLTGTASVTGSLIPIPAVCIGYEDGLALKDKLTAGAVKAKLEMTNFSEVIKARNVVATIPGTDKASEVILTGGHLDSWDLATGAIDNGIGSFSVIDIARTFKALDIKPRRTLKFVMWMGEEEGLLGSKHYVNALKESGEIENLKYVFNLDASSNAVGFNAGGRLEAEKFFVDAGDRIKAVDSTFTNKFANRAGLHSDHQSFMLEGVPFFAPVSNLDRSVYDCYHADCDDIDLVNEEHLVNNVRFSSMMLYELDRAQELPAAKLDDESTRKLLEDQGLKLKLRIQGDWRWSADD